MKPSSTIATVAVFSAMIVGSDFALAPVYNVKLLDTLVFVSAFLFGLRVGALVGILSESIWSFVSPEGMAGAVAPFLIGGELIFAVAGWGAARVWGRGFRIASPQSVFIGALLAVSAFAWDLETNLATALISFWPSPSIGEYLYTAFNPFTLAFAIAHEGSDFAFGALLAPILILLIPKVAGSRA